MDMVRALSLLDNIEKKVNELSLYVDRLEAERDLLKVELERADTAIKIATKALETKQPEWISVEDELPPAGVTILAFDRYGELHMHFFGNSKTAKGEITHWMPLPEPPKPKEPTFRDVFLEKFPNGLIELIQEKTCVNYFFRQFDAGNLKCDDCEACWSQPYFETEEEGGEE